MTPITEGVAGSKEELPPMTASKKLPLSHGSFQDEAVVVTQKNKANAIAIYMAAFEKSKEAA